MNIWFTSDQHFGHHNVITYCDRPYADTMEMDTAIKDNFNSLVKPTDVTYHLGDFTLHGKHSVIAKHLSELNGTHIIVLGNHDRFRVKEATGLGFVAAYTWHTILDNEFTLVHDPAKACKVGTQQKFLVGHVHGLFKRIDNVINVGVDVWDYKPVNLEDIRKEFDNDR